MCGDIYDTDFQMEMIDDEMVCDRCWEDWCEEQDREKFRMEPWTGDDSYTEVLQRDTTKGE